LNKRLDKRGILRRRHAQTSADALRNDFKVRRVANIPEKEEEDPSCYMFLNLTHALFDASSSHLSQKGQQIAKLWLDAKDFNDTRRQHYFTSPIL
jgi:hypothetical protein